ncbi:phosphoribosylamine--glycine ligase [Candidatus Cetobacterium colombiensis]|uniref:Phosphoribosylamine--glycine ligase n=1 Tax=Candidatus Cetobacterium colombiensis TaxID=3073100 RepID=A0ABU4WCQ0_9FUSO|nr:phosphoribosylamine--glycine ligase [Candidatus Cetobacterium colombiensis]MDX8337304.1 phosphoribosylamine--glycine ligase [Candidatus Cetobacterium colombiensis]
MKVLVVGKGGREHAIAWKVKESSLVKEVFIAPGNIGMENIGKLVNISEENIEALANFAQDNKIDLTIVGPESVLALGIVNEFEKRGLKIFGPTKEAAKIESSKDFAKKLMKKYKIPTGEYETFDNLEAAKAYVEIKGAPIVIKEDGLKAGKGVTVALKKDDAIEALEIAFSIPGNKVVIEEYLDGFEFSIIALTNGETVIPLEIAQDHKRAFDNDEGPNTGGMGVYSPVDKIDSKIVDETLEKILKPMAEGMKEDGIPFKGFLFGGIMLTKDGVKTIEFNARFGDPEAEGILPRLKSDFVKAILDLLDEKKVELQWDERYTVAVVMASENYPKSSTVGSEIEIPQNLDSLVFHMGTRLNNNKLETAGGRVLSVIAYGNTLEEAKNKAYFDVNKIKCKKLFFRNDIGSKMCYNNENK